MKPLVSIKMITYNHSPFIAQAIEGVLGQKTNFPFELVIGEDQSIDGTREIVFAYQKKHPKSIRVVTSEKNVGMKKNGLRTFRACRGKFIAFCEGDDFWQNPDKLQKQADYLELHPECGLVYSSYDVHHVESGRTIPNFIRYKKWNMPEKPSVLDFIREETSIGYAILTCTVMLRTQLYQQLLDADPFLHQSDHFLMGDTPLWAEMSTVSELHYMPESFSTHVITPESATRSSDITKVLRFQISCAEAAMYLCDKYKLPADVRKHHEANWCDASLRLAYHAHNPALADEVLKTKKTLTWEEWLRYHGVRNSLLHYSLRLAGSLHTLFRKKNSQWM